ncbi:WSC domain-containing protein [Apiospora rasikravindrae]|uniref:WSC domain-containing protein n=1 Tax=Apiospora rasikravindrae TaxID=990691 RepID=A0ABR1SFJ1_9PEZI
MASLFSPTMFLFVILAALLGQTVQGQKPGPGPQSFSGTPQVGSVVKDWKYLGCSTEIPGRALTGLSFSNDGMTIEACQDFCTKNNFPLSGVEYGRECYCGRFLAPPAGWIYNKDCDMPCKGNKNQMCGGNARVSVFNNTAFKGPQPLKTVAGTSWQYVSCFMEPLYGRALTTLVKADDRMTIPMCTSACQGAGFAFAGLEYGRECWCGATRSADLEDASDPMCAMQCDMPCGGDAATICGGRGAIGIFKDSSKKTKKMRRHHGEDHGGDGSGGGKRDHQVEEHAHDDYRDFGHGPVNVDIGARKGRFVKVVRRSPDGQRQVEREERAAS